MSNESETEIMTTEEVLMGLSGQVVELENTVRDGLAKHECSNCGHLVFPEKDEKCPECGHTKARPRK